MHGLRVSMRRFFFFSTPCFLSTPPLSSQNPLPTHRFPPDLLFTLEADARSLCSLFECGKKFSCAKLGSRLTLVLLPFMILGKDTKQPSLCVFPEMPIFFLSWFSLLPWSLSDEWAIATENVSLFPDLRLRPFLRSMIQFPLRPFENAAECPRPPCQQPMLSRFFFREPRPRPQLPRAVVLLRSSTRCCLVEVKERFSACIPHSRRSVTSCSVPVRLARPVFSLWFLQDRLPDPSIVSNESASVSLQPLPFEKSPPPPCRPRVKSSFPRRF